MKELFVCLGFVLLAGFFTAKLHSIYAIGLYLLVLILVLMWQNRCYKIRSIILGYELKESHRELEKALDELTNHLRSMVAVVPIPKKRGRPLGKKNKKKEIN